MKKSFSRTGGGFGGFPNVQSHIVPFVTIVLFVFGSLTVAIPVALTPRGLRSFVHPGKPKITIGQKNPPGGRYSDMCFYDTYTCGGGAGYYIMTPW